jgi:hypothetical protein
MTTTDHRKNAETHIERLVAGLERLPAGADRDALLSECRSLATAIRAFHMEGIRFRMFNVDRLLGKASSVAPDVTAEFREARESLEAAGFHTRSHQG